MIISTITNVPVTLKSLPQKKVNNFSKGSRRQLLLRWASVFIFGILLGSLQGQAQTTLQYYNLQYPFSANISTGSSVTVYAQVYQGGVTETAGAPAGINCWIGYSTNNVNPSDPSFTWVAAAYGSQVGNNDEFQLAIGSNLGAGTYYYASRFQRNGGAYYYGGSQGAWGNSSTSGVLLVSCNTAAPGGSSSQSFSAGASVADLVATGPGIQWYAGPSGGGALLLSTVLVDGNHYYASQVINGCESTTRLNVTVTVGALPVNIDFVNLQFPASATIAGGETLTAYARVYTAGVTEAAGAPAGITCWIGYSSTNVDPSDAAFTWVPAIYNAQSGNDDEFKGTFGNTLTAGTYYYASRFQRNAGPYYYGGNAGIWGGGNVSGILTVSCNPAPTGNASQAFTNGATVASLAATGTAIQWYATATAGTALQPSELLINGAHYFASQTIAGCESAGRLDVTVSILPSTLDYYNLQFPFTASITSAQTVTVYAQVYQSGVTEANGSPAGITCWIGYSSSNVDPSGASFTWVPATYNTQAGSNDEFQAAIGANLGGGTYYYASRFQRNGGSYYYGGTQGAWGGASISGVLTVACNVAAPTGSASQSFANGATVADLVATGTAIQWYAAASGGQPLSAADILVNGTHYFASQTTAGCESSTRLNVTVSVTAAPSTIDYVNLQFPSSAGIAVGGNITVYARIYTLNLTEAAGAPAGITGWIGYSSNNVDPSDPSFTWIPASYNAQSGNDDEFQATFGNTLPAGTYYYASRFQRNGGGYYYGGTAGFWGGASVSGVLYINCSPVPTGNASQSFAGGATVADLVATGSNIQWYATASGGQPLAASVLLINAAHYFATQTIAGCESAERLDVTVSVPPSTLDYYNLQYPFTANFAVGGNVTVYAQVYQGGVTEAAGAPAGINAWIGYSSTNVNPSDASFTWIAATYNAQIGNNDEFQATLGSNLPAGTYYYASRFQRNGGAYYYGGTGGAWGGSSISGVLTIDCITPDVPVITPGGPTTFCSGGAVLLSSSAVTGNQWYKNNSVLPGENGTTYLASTPGSYTVTASAGTCVSAQAAVVIVTVNPASVPAPVVTGIVNICPYIGTGDAVTYSFNAAGATGYSYILPPNVSLLNSSANSITVNFLNGFAAQPNKQLRVTALSPCGNSAQTIYYLLAQSPGTPGAITGNTNVCPVIGTASTYTYSIPAVTGATGYIWTAQAGTTTITHPNGTGINDLAVEVNFANGFTTSAITVQAVNGCGISNIRSIIVTKTIASTPSPISGPSNACAYIAPGGVVAVYAVTAVPGLTYNWNVPAGAINVTGQGTASVSFIYPNGFVSGNVTVTATNGCGTSTPRTLLINKLLPSATSAIDVIQMAPCPERLYTYTVSALPPNASGIQWTVPASASILSGQGTASISVSYPANSVTGTVTATAVNNCGSSTTRSVQVRLATCVMEKPMFAKAGAVAVSTPVEKFSVKVFPNPSVNDFKLQVFTAGKETIHLSLSDMQGRMLKQLVVLPYQTLNLGADLKTGAYLLEVRQGTSVNMTRLLKF